MMPDDEPTAIVTLDRRFPVKYCEGLVGLGQFILNLLEAPGDPETDAENIAIAVLTAIDTKQST